MDQQGFKFIIPFNEGGVLVRRMDDIASNHIRIEKHFRKRFGYFVPIVIGHFEMTDDRSTGIDILIHEHTKVPLAFFTYWTPEFIGKYLGVILDGRGSIGLVCCSDSFEEVQNEIHPYCSTKVSYHDCKHQTWLVKSGTDFVEAFITACS